MSDSDLYVRETYDILHQMPELGFQEYKTSAFLAKHLKEFGYVVETNVGGTGIVGILESSEPGQTLALRADMDALMHIVDGQETLIHSCGHDANSAMVLTAAKEIARRGLKKGRLKILFQPAEEILTGALKLIEAGVIDDIDIAIGIHLESADSAKLGQATPAVYHGAATMMQATIDGVSAHGARPHLGVNVIDAACLAVQAVNTIHLDPVVPTTVKATKFRTGGVSANIIPDKVELAFDLRSQKNTNMQELIKKTTLAIETAAASINAKASINSAKGVPAAEHDDEIIGVARDAIISVLGEEGLLDPDITLGGEDFHFFKQHKPALKTTFIGLGADLIPGLHRPEMTFNKAALIYGVNILLAIVDKLGGLK